MDCVALGIGFSTSYLTSGLAAEPGASERSKIGVPTGEIKDPLVYPILSKLAPTCKVVILSVPGIAPPFNG